jgi:diacylglycerol kinase family enzyme
MDDGKLDMCIVQRRWVLSMLLAIPKLFTGNIAKYSGYHCRQINSLVIRSEIGPLIYHVDGEPKIHDGPLEVNIHHRQLRVIVPDRPD